MSKGTVSKFLLDSMPSRNVPFKRVAAGIVRLLHPPVDKGNCSSLTLVDYATRVLQSYALPGTDTERVVEGFLYTHPRGNLEKHGKSVYVRAYEGGK